MINKDRIQHLLTDIEGYLQEQDIKVDLLKEVAGVLNEIDNLGEYEIHIKWQNNDNLIETITLGKEEITNVFYPVLWTLGYFLLQQPNYYVANFKVEKTKLQWDDNDTTQSEQPQPAHQPTEQPTETPSAENSSLKDRLNTRANVLAKIGRAHV